MDPLNRISQSAVAMVYGMLAAGGVAAWRRGVLFGISCGLFAALAIALLTLPFWDGIHKVLSPFR